MTIRVLHGDCRDVLPTLAANSVHCVVTSPPYYGLRDYGTAQWDGGDAGCDHAMPPTPHTGLAIAAERSDGKPRDESGTRFAKEATPYRDICGKCGARRIDRQIGLEATPEAYLATMVQVFREVRRVLRDDGTCWVNMGSSYSNGAGSNVTDQLNRLLEGGSVFFTSPGLCRVASHGVEISLHHQRTPDGVFSGLLAAQRDGIEQGHEHFGKVVDLLANPRGASASAASGTMVVQPAASQMLVGERQHGGVIGADSDAKAEPILAVLRPSSARAGEDDKAPLSVNEADEPSITHGVRWHSAWDTFAANASRKGIEDVYLVDDAIALGDRSHTLAGLLCDFRVAKATEQKLTLVSIHGGLTLAISDIRQLWFVLRCGSVVPYSKLYADASRFANALLPKQDLGMPWRLARALQEDGWILRSPIIWAKPNPMPESVTDRPTSAHEHVFLLSKAPRYYYDTDAVREEPTGRTDPIRSFGAVPDRNDAGHTYDLDGLKGRNLRNVWTIATHAFSAAHFATFPPELAERCIKAGCPRDGTVLDPFAGAGTTMLVADRLQRHATGIELNESYAMMARNRIVADAPLFAEVAD